MRAITHTTTAPATTANAAAITPTKPSASASAIQSRISPAKGARPTTRAETRSAGAKRRMCGGSLPRPMKLEARQARVTLGLAAIVLLYASGGLYAQPASPHVKDISLYRDGAGRVAWSAQGDWLAFDRRSAENGNYQLWIMKRDGTFERCLTCERADLRAENSINPTWHPSGDWIVFQVQSQAKRLGMGPVELATGDRGLWSELWVM